MTATIAPINNLSINQMMIEIRVLKVGKKQVTQAVFKQLPSKINGRNSYNHQWLLDASRQDSWYDFFLEDAGSIRGVLWGWVNHDIDGRKFWAIVQRGNRLLRIQLPCSPDNNEHMFWDDLLPETWKILRAAGQLFIAV